MITIPETFMAVIMLTVMYWCLFSLFERNHNTKINKPFLVSAASVFAVVAMTTGVWLVRLGQMMTASL